MTFKNGRASAGDVKGVERIGPVTIYRRGRTCNLYDRRGGEARRPQVEGNLAVATAAGVGKALAEERSSPLTLQRMSPNEFVPGYLLFVEEAQRRAWRTCQRYRAALERFLDLARDRGIEAMDRITVEDVVQSVR